MLNIGKQSCKKVYSWKMCLDLTQGMHLSNRKMGNCKHMNNYRDLNHPQSLGYFAVHSG